MNIILLTIIIAIIGVYTIKEFIIFDCYYLSLKQSVTALDNHQHMSREGIIKRLVTKFLAKTVFSGLFLGMFFTRMIIIQGSTEDSLLTGPTYILVVCAIYILTESFFNGYGLKASDDLLSMQPEKVRKKVEEHMKDNCSYKYSSYGDKIKTFSSWIALTDNQKYRDYRRKTILKLLLSFILLSLLPYILSHY